MRLLTIFVTVLLFSPWQSAFSEELSSVNEILTQELGLDKIDFNYLSQTENGNLRDLIGTGRQEESTLSSLNDYGQQKLVTPITQWMDSIQGEYCHIANYPTSSIITVFEGPHYGLQIVVDCYGNKRYVNRHFIIEHTPTGGMILRHRYPDCVVITGKDQVVLFP